MGLIKFECSNIFHLSLYTISSGLYYWMYMVLVTSLYQENLPQIILILLDALTYVLFIIPDLIIHFRKKHTNHNDDTPSTMSSFDTSFQDKIIKLPSKYTLQNCLFIILLGFLSTTISFFMNTFVLLVYTGFNIYVCICNMLLTWSLVYLWQRVKLVRHHFLSLVILLLIAIIHTVLLVIIKVDIYQAFSSYWICFAFGLVVVISISMREVIEKYLMDKASIGETRIMFCEGVVSTILYGIFYAFMSMIDCLKVNYVNLSTFCLNSGIEGIRQSLRLHFENYSPWMILPYALTLFCMNYCRTLLNKKHNSSLRYTGDLLAFNFALFFSRYMRQLKDHHLLVCIFLIGEMIIFVMVCMLYYENIRIYACRLEYMTKYEINARAIQENSVIYSEMAKYEELDGISDEFNAIIY